MPKSQHQAQSMDISTAQRDLGRLVEDVATKGTRVLLELNGESLAALVSPKDLDQLNRLDAYRHDPWSVIDDIHARNVDADPEGAERDIAEAVAAVRDEQSPTLSLALPRTPRTISFWQPPYQPDRTTS